MEKSNFYNNVKLPECPKYFKDLDITHEVELDEEYEKILLSRVNVKVGEISLVKTPVMVSNEGRCFTGYKVMVELNCQEIIKYMPKVRREEVLVIRKNIVKNIFITIPEKHNNKSIQEFVRLKKLIITPYIEDIYVYQINERMIKVNISIFVDCSFKEER